MPWNTGLAKIGAIFYVLWGLLHYSAAYGVYQFAQSTPLAIEHGRLEQLAFYLASFATAGIVLARLNWRNNRLGFWFNAVIIGIGDIPFILFVLVPGYVPVWPGILGPVLWVAGMTCTAIAQVPLSGTIGGAKGARATPAAGAKAGATQGTFMTSDAIPWKPADPRKPDGVQMFVVWGNPKDGPSGILLKFPAGTDAGWHWHTAAYQGIVIQGKATHTVKGAAPQTGGPGSVWSQPAGQVHDDKCEEGGDCIEFAYFDGKLDFIPVESSYRYQ